MIAPAPSATYLTKTEIILEALRQRVMTGAYAPGQRLILRAIADEFACSDIPVREAMRSLASERLVTITPHEGARVAGLDSRELIEATQTRGLIEPTATVLAAMHITEETMKALALMIETMAAIAARDDAEAYGKLNRQFHRAILAHCPNRTMVQLIEDLWSRAERGLAVHRLFDAHLAKSMEHHLEIVRCIREQDLSGLRRISERHCAHGLAAVRKLCEDSSQASPVSMKRRRSSPDMPT